MTAQNLRLTIDVTTSCTAQIPDVNAFAKKLIEMLNENTLGVCDYSATPPIAMKVTDIDLVHARIHKPDPENEETWYPGEHRSLSGSVLDWADSIEWTGKNALDMASFVAGRVVVEGDEWPYGVNVIYDPDTGTNCFRVNRNGATIRLYIGDKLLRMPSGEFSFIRGKK